MLSSGHCNFRFWKDFLQIKKKIIFLGKEKVKMIKKLKYLV